MLAPAVGSLLDVDITSTMMKDFTDEEQHKKSEIEQAEKDVFLYKMEYLAPLVRYQRCVNFDDYRENDSRFISEIVLPPPKFQV